MSEINKVKGQKIEDERELIRMYKDDLDDDDDGVQVKKMGSMEKREGNEQGIRKNVIDVKREIEDDGVVLMEEGELIEGGEGVRMK